MARTGGEEIFPISDHLKGRHFGQEKRTVVDWDTKTGDCYRPKVSELGSTKFTIFHFRHVYFYRTKSPYVKESVSGS